MNWQAVSFDWNQARAFLVTAEEGSLSAAARALCIGIAVTLGTFGGVDPEQSNLNLASTVDCAEGISIKDLEHLNHVAWGCSCDIFFARCRGRR